MSFFIATSDQPFSGPHQNQQLLQAGADPASAKAAMIMIHGRGASAESILGLANELDHQNSITFYAPQASGHTWYPYSFLAPTDQNQPGLNSGLQAVFDAVQQAESDGFSKDQIFLLGFSQGACLASEFVARHPQKYAGLIVLSGGLIGDTLPKDHYSGDLESTPVFMGCSDVDAHIPEQRVHESAEILSTLNADVTKKIYPGMGHTINQDEIDQINRLILASI
ncbi:MAG: alpha/beta fold hydrolase [bacterium]|nr:alpha/beta fold hydrolase [bacterium]